MIYRKTGFQRFAKLLMFSLFMVMSVVIAAYPQLTQAEGNEPTLTLTPTISVTLPPTDTPMPTETPQEDAADVEAKSLEVDNAVGVSSGNSGPEAQSWVTTPNLCLLGLIVVAAIVVIVIVVLGVMGTVGGTE